MTKCTACGHPVGTGHKFCGNCGHIIIGGPELVDAPSGSAAPSGGGTPASARKARLRLIRGDGADGFTFQLHGQEHPAGRIKGPILFPDDPTVSPTHANFYYEGNRLFVRDEGSRNGTYIRIYEPARLTPGEEFLAGEQILRFERFEPQSPIPGADGATFGGTPITPWRFRLVQVLQGGRPGLVYCARKRSVTLGREDCDLSFIHDRYISRYHCRVEERDDGFFLKDLDSRNGTYVKVKQPTPVKDGDFLFIGRQLLRVELG